MRSLRTKPGRSLEQLESEFQLCPRRRGRPGDAQKVLEQAGIHFTDDEAGEIGVRLQIGKR
jgi:hypothetical protein